MIERKSKHNRKRVETKKDIRKKRRTKRYTEHGEEIEKKNTAEKEKNKIKERPAILWRGRCRRHAYLSED